MRTSTIFTIIAVIIVGFFGVIIADFVFNVPVLRSLPVSQKIGCSYPVVIKGDSMSPTLKNGERVVFNRCVEGVNLIAPGTIVVFEERGTRIGRIVSKESDENGIFYKITRDGAQDVFEVRPDLIKAVKK